MKTLTLIKEFQALQKLYGNYYISRVFHDFDGYKGVRGMNSFQEIADELICLENLDH